MCLLVVTLLISAFPATLGRRYIVNGAFVIKPGYVQRFGFHVGEDGGAIQGRFRSADNIEVYIMDNDSYENWINGAKVQTYYSSGRITVSNINVPLEEGDYQLVFSNRYSVISNKAVTASITLNE